MKTVEVLEVPRWARGVDLALALAWLVGVGVLAARLAGPLLQGEPVALTVTDGLVLLGLVCAPALGRALVLWPRLNDRLEVPAEARAAQWAWPGPVVRVAGREVCAASVAALGPLGVSGVWARWRAVALEAGLRRPALRLALMALWVVALAVPVFALGQAIEYGSAWGLWNVGGPAAFVRALVKTGLAVGVWAAVWWGVVLTVVQLVWAALCARGRSPGAEVWVVLWLGRLAWVAAPLALVLRALR